MPKKYRVNYGWLKPKRSREFVSAITYEFGDSKEYGRSPKKAFEKWSQEDFPDYSDRMEESTIMNEMVMNFPNELWRSGLVQRYLEVFDEKSGLWKRHSVIRD